MLLAQLKHLATIYVEDDDFTRTLYAQMLGRLFTDLRLAADGAEALKLYRERPCDLVLTDLQMPGLGGLQLCRELRLLSPELPIIIISSHDEGDLLLQTANLGIDGYLIKPVTPQLLHRALLKVAERLIARQQVEQAARTWSHTFDAIPDLIAVLDDQYRVVTLNKAAQEQLQLSQQEAVGRDYCLTLHKENVLPAGCALRRQDGGCCMRDVRNPIAMLDGYFNVTVSPITDEQGQRSGVVHVARNVTEKTLADLEVVRSEARYRMLLNSGYDAILVYGVDEKMQPGCFTEVNEAACRMFGYQHDELLALKLVDLHPSQNEDQDGYRIEQLLEDGKVLLEVEACKKDGTVFSAELSSHLFFLNGHHQVLTILRDCTERKRQEAALQYVSTHDQLTGVYNRSWFETELARLVRGRNWPISFVMVDLNELKLANDRLGHAAGDALLCRAVEVLQQSCRADEMISRVGGDEFIVLLPGTTGADAESIMLRIGNLVEQQSTVIPRLSLALGMATAQTAEHVAEALALADQRMYQDKADRKAATAVAKADSTLRDEADLC